MGSLKQSTHFLTLEQPSLQLSFFLQRVDNTTTFHFVMPSELESFSPSRFFNECVDETLGSEGCVCTILARKQSGKTRALIQLLRHLNHRGVPRIVVFSETENAQQHGAFEGIVPETCCYPHFNPEVLEQIYNDQEELLCEKKILEKNDPEKVRGLDLRIAIILDDCAHSRPKLNHEIMSKIAFMGRHPLIYFFLTSQRPMKIPPDIRANSDLTLMGTIHEDKQRRDVHKEFVSCCDRFDDFNDMYTSATQGYRFLVKDNLMKSDHDLESLSLYESMGPGEELATFRFGADWIWDFDRLNKITDEERLRRLQEERVEREVKTKKRRTKTAHRETSITVPPTHAAAGKAKNRKTKPAKEEFTQEDLDALVEEFA